MAEPPTTLDVLLALTRLESKLDSFVGQTTDHETRIRNLERSKWPLPSISVLLALGAFGLTAIQQMN